MSSNVFRSVDEPIRKNLTWDERWLAEDKGLIHCWELGRLAGEKDPSVATKAQCDELPVLHWKGGVEKELQAKEKFGSLFYLAQWLGLRGEDLDIDLSAQYELVCSKTEVKVIFSRSVTKKTHSSNDDVDLF